MTTQIASASGNPIEVKVKYVGGRGEPGQDGTNGSGLNDIRFVDIINPMLSIFKKTQIADVVAPSNSNSDVVCVRATTKSYIDLYGILRAAAVNEIAIEKDGALIEMASTNKCLYSEQYDNAAWSKSGVTVTANSTTAPDLTTNADALAFGASATIDQAISITGSGQNITYSVFVKDSGIGSFTMRWITTGGTTQDYSNVFDFSLGDFSSVDPNCTTEVIPLSNDWYRICVTATENGSGSTAFRPRFFSLAGGNMYSFGSQVEEQKSCTSYIKTTTTSVTRNADNIEVQFYNNVTFNGEWTFFANVKLYDRASNAAIWGVEPIPAANNPRLLVTSTGSLLLVDSTGTTKTIASAGVIPNNEVVRIAVRSTIGGNIDAVINGVPQLAPQVADINNISTGNMKIGETGLAAEQKRVNIDNFTWYDKLLTDVEIEYLSN